MDANREKARGIAQTVVDNAFAKASIEGIQHFDFTLTGERILVEEITDIIMLVGTEAVKMMGVGK